MRATTIGGSKSADDALFVSDREGVIPSQSDTLYDLSLLAARVMCHSVVSMRDTVAHSLAVCNFSTSLGGACRAERGPTR